MKHLNYFNSHSEYTDPTITPNVSYCKLEDEVHYNPYVHDYSQDYLTIKSLEDNNTISLYASIASIAKTVSVSIDNGTTWTEYTSSTGSGTTLAILNEGDEVLIKGENNTYATTSSKYNQFKTTGQFETKGNIMSLISGDSFANANILTATYTFRALFHDCTGLTSAENLVLPATTLTDICYCNMFSGCTSLITTPELPATALALSCYDSMFKSCTSLTSAPMLPATTLQASCYGSMFYGCTSLTTAPELPAIQLRSYCYESMFQDCTSLNYIKAMFTTTPGTDYTRNWVSGVAASGTFVKNSAAVWTTTGTGGIPTGWTVETASN